jgi:hypothetical protein
MIQQSPAKTKSFLKAINKAAMQKCSDIAKQIEETTAAEMQRAEDEARRDGHLKIEAAKAKIEAQAKLKVALYENEKKKEIYSKRYAYQKEVFARAKAQLQAFAAGDEYAALVEKRLSGLSDKVGKNLTFKIRPDDTVAKNAIQKAYPSAAIETDPTIRIGAYKVIDRDKSILIDETLDAGLENQLDWFLLNSKLKVEL